MLWRNYAYHSTDQHHAGYRGFILYLINIIALLLTRLRVFFKHVSYPVACAPHTNLAKRWCAHFKLGLLRLLFKVEGTFERFFPLRFITVFTTYSIRKGGLFNSISRISYLRHKNTSKGIPRRVKLQPELSSGWLQSSNDARNWASGARYYSSSKVLCVNPDPTNECGGGYSKGSNTKRATLEKSAKLDPYFVTGLTEAEGSFSITKHRDARAKFGMTISLRFKITMLVNEIALLKKVQVFFGVGFIINDEKRGTVDYTVRDKISLGVIKKHFIKHPLRGTKFLDFCDFVQALELMEQNLHRSDEAVKFLVNISEGMNSLRKDYSKMPPVHVIKSNSEFIPLNGNYINGFIAGDGCLYLQTKSNFGSMGIQISQHVNNSYLIREILDYFQSLAPRGRQATKGSEKKVYVHGKKSIQITIGGKKIWQKVIYPHFLKYPLHGSKILRLEKMIAIAKIIESREHLKKVGRAVVFKPEYKERIIRI